MMRFQTRSDTSRAVQPQKMARGLKFQIKEIEGLYYLCRKDKGIDQLHGYTAADQCFHFRKCKKQVFSRRDSYGCEENLMNTFKSANISISP